MYLAYQIAALPRRKRFPSSPKSLFIKRGSRDVQTWQQQMATMDLWVHHTRKVERQQREMKQKRIKTKKIDARK